MTTLRSPAEARAYLRQRDAARADSLTDGELPSYLATRYGVTIEGSARADAAPPVRTQYRQDTRPADAAQRDKRPGDSNIDPHPEVNAVTGEPLTDYERYRRDYYKQRAATAGRDLLAPTAPLAPAPQGPALPTRDAAEARRQAGFARLAQAHADRSQDAVDPSARGQAPARSAPTAKPGQYDPFAAYRQAYEAARGRAVVQ